MISGLDPAGPLFENDGPQDRLDSGDADLVDVIHSNGEKIYMGGLGAWAPMGDIDFYPNGGRMQKGCTNLFVGAVTDMIWCRCFDLFHLTQSESLRFFLTLREMFGDHFSRFLVSCDVRFAAFFSDGFFVAFFPLYGFHRIASTAGWI